MRDFRKKNIGIETKLEYYAPGQKTISIDSATLERYNLQSLSTLLSQQLPVFVKSYGFNSVATVSFRGASAAQSQVLWEGIPLQNAASGIADVSLMPVALLDDVSVVYGSSAALLGSGNVGGALILQSKKPEFIRKDPFITISFGAGSYHQLQLGAKADFNRKKWSFSLKTFLQSARNDFRYKATDGSEQRMPNDSSSGVSALTKFSYEVNAHNTLSLQTWMQWYDRSIPPALFESYSVKKQHDEAYRFVFDWKHSKQQNWYFKTAYLHDILRYNDTAIGLDSKGVTNHFFAEAGWDKPLKHYRSLLLFMPAQLLLFNGNDQHQQLKMALAGAFRQSLLKEKIDLALNARAESINGKFVFLPGINASYKQFTWLKWQANIQYSYRNPTLNELYYNPGGNPDLKPEHGWHMDAGYNTRIKLNNTLFLTHNLSVFNRNIDDWIIWLGGAIWTPHNLASVHSRGLETENNLLARTGQFECHLAVNASYTRSTITRSYITNDNSIGRQIPYTPTFNANVTAGISWKKIELNYNHSYTDTRYITTDESQSLEPYSTGNIQLSWIYGKDWRNVRLFAQCQNIADIQYEVVGFRPMPGRTWLFGLTVKSLD